uniref:Uncharacterized protein n=1 Tax=Dendroctonus ponderosae TaxID=77166 RepID=A0AAR5QHD2_DENPD
MKKPNPLPKRTVPAAKTATASSSKAVAPVSKPASKISSKAATKASVKSNPVVDQKKTKMIAPIGRNSALVAASKSSTKSTSPKSKYASKYNCSAQLYKPAHVFVKCNVDYIGAFQSKPGASPC